LYQDLPAYTKDLFVDVEGRPVRLDLYDVAPWMKYQWSVFSPSVKRRLEQNRHPELFGDSSSREAFLERALRNAELMQTVLREGSEGSTAGRYYLIQNDFNATPARAVLVEEGDEWATYFAGDEALERFPELAGRLEAAGDGHATLDSQRWLSETERELLSPVVMNVQGSHFEMIHNPEAQRYLLEILADQDSSHLAPEVQGSR
jgi:hypothetical protein